MLLSTLHAQSLWVFRNNISLQIVFTLRSVQYPASIPNTHHSCFHQPRPINRLKLLSPHPLILRSIRFYIRPPRLNSQVVWNSTIFDCKIRTGRNRIQRMNRACDLVFLSSSSTWMSLTRSFIYSYSRTQNTLIGMSRSSSLAVITTLWTTSPSKSSEVD